MTIEETYLEPDAEHPRGQAFEGAGIPMPLHWLDLPREIGAAFELSLSTEMFSTMLSVVGSAGAVVAWVTEQIAIIGAFIQFAFLRTAILFVANIAVSITADA